MPADGSLSGTHRRASQKMTYLIITRRKEGCNAGIKGYCIWHYRGSRDRSDRVSGSDRSVYPCRAAYDKDG